MNVFLKKYGHENSVLFREYTFFDKIWAREHRFFREKSDKKGHSVDFNAHNIL